MAKSQSELNFNFKKKCCRRYELYFHKEKECELLAYFESIENKQKFIKELILEKMKSS